MAEQTPIRLDNPALRGRLRQPADWNLTSRTNYVAPAARPAQRKYAPPAAPAPSPQAPPAPVQKRQYVHEPDWSAAPKPLRTHRSSKLQASLVAMAGVVFLAGLAVSLQALQTNHNVTAQVSALSKQASAQAGTNAENSVPGTTRPSRQAFSQYTVAPDVARYIRIPRLGVNARVMQVGVNSSGALGTPSTVFDTAWYTGSAKPGQPGATLIDGHVSSWTTRGVFYGIKNLKPADIIQIVRGDGAELTYKVVKIQLYDANNVDMKAAVNPVTPGISGLNLITCAGQVKPGTSDFSQRVIIFAQQI